MDSELKQQEKYWTDFFAGKKPKLPEFIEEDRKIIRSKTVFTRTGKYTTTSKSKVSRMFEPQADHIYVTAPSYWNNQSYPLKVQVGAEIMEVDKYLLLDRTEGKLHISRRGIEGSHITWHYKKTKIHHIA